MQNKINYPLYQEYGFIKNTLQRVFESLKKTANNKLYEQNSHLFNYSYQASEAPIFYLQVKEQIMKLGKKILTTWYFKNYVGELRDYNV